MFLILRTKSVLFVWEGKINREKKFNKKIHSPLTLINLALGSQLWQVGKMKKKKLSNLNLYTKIFKNKISNWNPNWSAIYLSAAHWSKNIQRKEILLQDMTKNRLELVTPLVNSTRIRPKVDQCRRMHACSPKSDGVSQFKTPDLWNLPIVAYFFSTDSFFLGLLMSPEEEWSGGKTWAPASCHMPAESPWIHGQFTQLHNHEISLSSEMMHAT